MMQQTNVLFARSGEHKEGRVTIRSAIATVVGCILLAAAIGAGIGYALGMLAPEYYRSVFWSGWEPGFDPVRVGVGQGLTQGTAGGVVVGLGVVALLCWREVRLQRIDGPLAPVGNLSAKSGATARRVLLVTGSALALGLCLSTGLVLGLLGGEQSVYHRRFLEEQEAIAPLLASDPAFSKVELHEYSAGGVYLMGEVSTAEDLSRLRVGVIRAVGERRAREVMAAVGVRR
jgi:hypothetical protein